MTRDAKQTNKRTAKKKGPADTSVGRALKIIELMMRNGGTISELSQRAELAKSTVSYLLKILVHLKYLRHNQQTNRYTLGVRLFNISGHAMHEMQLRDVAQNYLQTIVNRTGLGANLGILDHTSVLYIDRIEPPG